MALAAFSSGFQSVSAEIMKCYGVAEAGENGCGALDHDGHSCNGQSVRTNHAGDWKMADSVECAKQGGLTEEQARKKLGLPAKI